MFDEEDINGIADSVRGMADMPVWQIVLICVISVAVPVAVVWWVRKSSPDLVPTVVICLVVLVICLVLLFWPQISTLLSGRTVSYLAVAAVALVVGGLAGWAASGRRSEQT